MGGIYVVNYVGNDSKDHEVRVEASSHTAAIAAVEKLPGVDFVVGVRHSGLVFNTVVILIGVAAIAAVIFWLF